MIISPSVCTRAHTDDPSWIRHLVIDLAKSWRHLVGEGAGNDHDIGLSRRSTENYTKSVLVVARCGKVHHLDGAASEPKGHRP